MTSYGKSVDLTEANAGNGNVVSAVAGTGGTTAGCSLKLSGGTVVKCTAKTDVFYGVALTTESAGAAVKVLRSGCKVKVAATLTADGYVQPKDGGSGEWEDYTNGNKVAIVETSATLASVIRIL